MAIKTMKASSGRIDSRTASKPNPKVIREIAREYAQERAKNITRAELLDRIARK